MYVLVAGLTAFAFSCQKDSLPGISNEELALRGPGDEVSTFTLMKNFKTSYELFEVDALPDEEALNGLEPPKGYVPRMYSMNGTANFLGELAPGMSYEIHFLPPDADLNKDTVEAWACGRLLSRENIGALRYVGQCTWYPDGRRESTYRFFRGTGCFGEVSGWMEGQGLAKNEGAYMKLEAGGKISMPLFEAESSPPEDL